MKHLAAFLLPIALGSCASSAPTDLTGACGAPPLTTDQILKLAQSEIERHGGTFDSRFEHTKYRITRDGCDYLFLLTADPPRPGDAVVIRIDAKGSVVRYTTGA